MAFPTPTLNQINLKTSIDFILDDILQNLSR
jgi:hypothetical protein